MMYLCGVSCLKLPQYYSNFKGWVLVIHDVEERSQRTSSLHITEVSESQIIYQTCVMFATQVLAVTTLAETCIWYCRLRSAAEIPEGVINFFRDFAWNAVIQPAAKTVV